MTQITWQISCRVQQWKNFKDWSTYIEVMNGYRVAHFYGSWCISKLVWKKSVGMFYVNNSCETVITAFDLVLLVHSYVDNWIRISRNWRCDVGICKLINDHYLLASYCVTCFINHFAAHDERNSSRSTHHVCVWRVTLIILSYELADPTHTPLHYWHISHCSNCMSPHSALQGACSEVVK